jgi:transcriptional regulator with XRE-family HTH domain
VFSKNFKKLLEEKGISVRKAAEIAGTSSSTVSGWLNGVNPADPSVILKLCEALGADFQYILTGKVSLTFTPNRLNELFDIEDAPDFSGLYLLEAKKLKWRKK